ncbi:hypothetical protein BHM03_00003544 [Ensete ventricosum]|uniref:Profilin n=1 Tax=Ensete ventricosum TaxID=4639 RepID=A0A426ZT37_ENSVE|nr:hypothetical protein B296_00025788 [Ensete ventricosum]RZR78275.1 hypothetical protein BHM03_00003544 [Ensete ventricosum]
MSWQTYVDDHLMCDIDGQRLTAAAIVGHDGSVWAQSELFPQVSSLLLSVCLPVYAYRLGSGGVTIKKTNLALIFGIYVEPMTPGQCNMVVERLGDYLFDQGF